MNKLKYWALAVFILSSCLLCRADIYGQNMTSSQPYGWSEWDSEDDDLSWNNCDDQVYMACPITGDVYVKYTAGKGVGYPTGYTTAGLFYAPVALRCERLQPFLDLRVHVLDNARRAVNAGFGARYLVPQCNAILGLNVFYDFREARRVSHDFHQMGIGFEMLGCCFDFRANGYFPVGEKTHSGCRHQFSFPGGFFATCRKQQTALAGGDFEFETSLCRLRSCFRCLNSCSCCCWDPYIAAGGYFYDRDCCRCRRIDGWKIRSGVGLCDWLRAEVRVSHDSVFKTLVQGVFVLSYPICEPAKACCETTCCYDCRYLTPIERQEMIVLEDHCRFRANWR